MLTLIDRLRGMSEPIILTHDARFHADELLAIAVIMEALGDRKVIINRSRDPGAMAKADVVIDVGGRRNPFDHHYYDAPRHSNGIPYASCGLVLDAVEPDPKLRQQLYCDLFYAVEWDDNSAHGEIYHHNWDLKPNLLAWVSSFQPLKEEAASEYELREYFDKALEMVRLIYRRVRRNAIIKIKNRQISDRTTYNVINGVLHLDKETTPYIRFVNEHPEVRAVVVPEKGGYLIKVMRNSPSDPCLRASFPPLWYGQADEDLFRISRINDVVWCSNSGDKLRCKSSKAVAMALKYLN